MNKVKKSFTLDEDVYNELKTRAKKSRESTSSFLNKTLAKEFELDKNKKEKDKDN